MHKIQHAAGWWPCARMRQWIFCFWWDSMSEASCTAIKIDSWHMEYLWLHRNLIGFSIHSSYAFAPKLIRLHSRFRICRDFFLLHSSHSRWMIFVCLYILMLIFLITNFVNMKTHILLGSVCCSATAVMRQPAANRIRCEPNAVCKKSEKKYRRHGNCQLHATSQQPIYQYAWQKCHNKLTFIP